MLRYDWRWLLVIALINTIVLMSLTTIMVGTIFSRSGWLRRTPLITNA
jgi:hypothetical protein